MSHKRNLNGQRFGRLAVLHEVPRGIADHQRKWRCRCDCGRYHEVVGPSLINGLTKSCGCLRRETTSKRAGTHRLGHTSEYMTWADAKGRCHRVTHKNYHYYGARGIYMCPEWRDSFEQFYRDMGPRPEGLSLDRIDNDGPYAKWNCRWTDRFTQARNTRRTRRHLP